MGTEVAEEDILNMKHLADQVIAISEYRAALYDYLRNRMAAIAPNLTVMVGELVGARLIAHAGSLLSLAKHPASTVQILGAEKALFRALKTKHDTPKYGLIYHASLVGQAAPKYKGKISRVLAAKTSLSIRMDALGDTDGPTIGIQARAQVERRLAQLEGGKLHALSKNTGGGSTPQKSAKGKDAKQYNTAADSTLDSSSKKKKSAAAASVNGMDSSSTADNKARPTEAVVTEVDDRAARKAAKRAKKEAADTAAQKAPAASAKADASAGETKKKKEKKRKAGGVAEESSAAPLPDAEAEEAGARKKAKKAKKAAKEATA